MENSFEIIDERGAHSFKKDAIRNYSVLPVGNSPKKDNENDDKKYCYVVFIWYYDNNYTKLFYTDLENAKLAYERVKQNVG